MAIIRHSQPQPDFIVRHVPFYYGWIIWAVATLGLISTAPAQAFSISLFMDRFIADFNLSRSTISGLFSLGTLVAAFSLTWVGRKVDRYGNRRSSWVISGLFAAVVAFMAVISGPFMLLIGFVALRGLGQGALSLASTSVIAQWFAKRRGRMMSLALLIFSLFQAAYVPLLDQILDRYDWRLVWLGMAVWLALVTLPLMALFMRDRPEDIGQELDGRKITREQALAELKAENGWHLAEARRTPIFWVFTVGRLAAPLMGSGLILHQVSIFAAGGHSQSIAAQTFGLMALISAFKSIAFGFLLDRIRPGYVMGLHLFGVALACFMAMNLEMVGARWFFALGLGIVMGGGFVFDGTVWANLFGREFQNEIRGFIEMVRIVGTAIGPILFALSYDLTGGYSLILWTGVILALIPMLSAPFMDKPRRPQPRS